MLSAQRLVISATRETPPAALLQRQEGISVRAECEEYAVVPALSRQLDELWHYSCVVSPLTRTPTSPLSPVSACSPGAASPDLVNPSPSPFDLVDHHAHESSAGAASDDDYQRHVILHRVFNTFDENRDGLVSTHEIVAIFQKLGIPAQNERSIQSLLASLVTKTAGHVDELEFCLLYDFVCKDNIVAEPNNSSSGCCLQGDVDEDLLAAFNVFDKDGNGLISPMELQSVLCSLGFPQAQRLDACVEMIARVDDNADGHVDFFEFKKLFYPDESPNVLISSF